MAIRRSSRGQILAAAQGAVAAGLQGGQQPVLQLRGECAGFLEHQSAGAAAGEQTGMIAAGTVEGATQVAKELRFQHLFRQGAAIEYGEGFLRAAAGEVDRFGQQPLAAPLRSGDGQIDIGNGHPPGLAQQLFHGRTATDDAAAPALIAALVGGIQGGSDGIDQMAAIKGGSENTESSLSGGLQGFGQYRLIDDENTGDAGIFMLQLFAQGQSGTTRGTQITEYQFGRHGGQLLQGLLSTAGGVDAETSAKQVVVELLQLLRVLINKQNLV